MLNAIILVVRSYQMVICTLPDASLDPVNFKGLWSYHKSYYTFMSLFESLHLHVVGVILNRKIGLQVSTWVGQLSHGRCPLYSVIYSDFRQSQKAPDALKEFQGRYRLLEKEG